MDYSIYFAIDCFPHFQTTTENSGNCTIHLQYISFPYSNAGKKRDKVSKHFARYVCLLPIHTVKKVKFGTPKIIAVNALKIVTVLCYNAVMDTKEADGTANCVDPDQAAPLGAV